MLERNHLEVLRSAVLKDIPFEVVDSAPSRRDLSLRFFGALLICLGAVFWRYPRVAFDPLNWHRLAKRLWIMAKVRQHNPRVVLTIIDNNNYFHWMCQNYAAVGSARFVAIQNGNRVEQDFLEDSCRKAFHDIYFSFGDQERDLFKTFGHELRELIPVGSMMADYFRATDTEGGTAGKPQEYDLGIVSSWQGELPYTPDRRTMYATADKMHRILAQHLAAHKLQAAVFMGTNSASNFGMTKEFGDELTYLQSIYGDLVEYVHRAHFSTYRGMSRSRVVVGFMSSAVKEAYGWGQKALYCDFTGSERFSPYEPQLVLRDADYEALKSRIDQLLSTSSEEYAVTHRVYQKHLMNYPSPQRTHEVIHARIKALCAPSGGDEGQRS